MFEESLKSPVLDFIYMRQEGIDFSLILVTDYDDELVKSNAANLRETPPKIHLFSKYSSKTRITRPAMYEVLVRNILNSLI